MKPTNPALPSEAHRAALQAAIRVIEALPPERGMPGTVSLLNDLAALASPKHEGLTEEDLTFVSDMDRLLRIGKITPTPQEAMRLVLIIDRLTSAKTSGEWKQQAADWHDHQAGEWDAREDGKEWAQWHGACANRLRGLRAPPKMAG